MRAKSVNFERGRDPRSQMGIGNPYVQKVVDYLYDEYIFPTFWEENFDVHTPSKKIVTDFVLDNPRLLKELNSWEDDWLPEENLDGAELQDEFTDWYLDFAEPVDWGDRG